MARAADCPYCGLPLGDEEPTRDHVFIEAMGGHSRVDAHRDCNSRIGHDIEGVLQRGDTMLNLQRQVIGTGKPLRATIKESGDRVEVDLATRSVRFHKPVVDADQDGIRTRTVRGNPQQVDAVLKAQGFNAEQRGEMIAGASLVRLSDVHVDVELRHDLLLADRLVAKVALGAGSLVDAAFSASPLAARLRDVLWNRGNFDGRYEDDPLAGFDTGMADVFARVGLTPPRSLMPGVSGSQVAFLPLGPGRDQSGIVVHVGGQNVSLTAVGLDVPMPFGRGMPVVLRDRPGAPELISVWQEMERAVIEGVQEAASPPRDTTT